MAELKKCPFCGSKARMVDNHNRGTVHIRCDDEFGTCSVLPCTEEGFHFYEVENEWNNRATEAELRANVIDEFYDEVLNFEDYIEPIEERNGVLLYSGRDITYMIVDIKRKLKGDKE